MSPWPRSSRASHATRLPSSLRSNSLHVADECCGGLGERDAVLRALRPGQARLTSSRSRRSMSVKMAPAPSWSAQALLLGIGLHELDGLARSVVLRYPASFRRPGRSRRSRHIPAPCCDRGAVGERHVRRDRRRRTRRTCRPRPSCAAWRDGEYQVGGRGALGQLAVSLKPTTSGISIGIGWPSMAASASMPPTPQPSTERPFTMVVWLSVPTSVSG